MEYCVKLDLITDLPKLEQVEIDNGVRHYTAEGVGLRIPQSPLCWALTK